MTNPDCDQCEGTGYTDYQRRDESIVTVVCECNPVDEQDREDEDCDDTIGGDNK